MHNLAIIPARGGSKRIPHKNIKNFKGKPIIAYSIENAMNCGLFDEVMVSTDDTDIASLAINYGAKVPFLRSEKNSDDYAITMDVLQEVVFEYEKQNIFFDTVCCIYPTAPLITINNLIEGYQKLIDQNSDVVYPVVAFSYPILRGLLFDENENLRMKWPEYYKTRSQDLEQIYHDSGQWYWYKVESLRINKFDVAKAVILSELNVQDIDNEADWLLAELKYDFLNREK
jgi:pseudaminic acid cytidylyltransferase